MLARINPRRIEKIADVLCSMPVPEDGNGMDFCGDLFPSPGDPQAVNFFSFSCIQNHGFWYSRDGRYDRPITGHVGGREYRGSELLLAALKREYDRDCGVFQPYRLAHMSGCAIRYLLADDLGPIPLPDIYERVDLTHCYGGHFRSAPPHLNSPKKLLAIANRDAYPIAMFYRLFSHVPGFCEDPLQKKIGLFAMEMMSRPEKFLVPADGEDIRPIIDYHIMRVCLRSGMVVLAKALRAANIARTFVSAEMESAVRLATYRAVELLAALVRGRLPHLRRVMSFVDHALWKARVYCPEQIKPDCPTCVFTAACRKDTDLFQPVCRTMYY